MPSETFTVNKDRDSKGRFIHGNTPVNTRDPVTGRFVSTKHIVPVVSDAEHRYIKTRIEVDAFLKEH